MPKRPFSVGLSERLQDPDYATDYLNAALQDSNEAFLLAVRDVVDAKSMTAVARSAKLDRVNLYRMLSQKGNPRLSSLSAVLDSLELQINVVKRDSNPNHIARFAHPSFFEASSYEVGTPSSDLAHYGKIIHFDHAYTQPTVNNVVGTTQRKAPGRETQVAANNLFNSSALTQRAANYYRGRNG